MHVDRKYSAINLDINAALKKAGAECLELKNKLPKLRKGSDGNYNIDQLKIYFEILPHLRAAQLSLILLSCTLIESIINLYLSTQLTTEQFDSLEKITLLDKWASLPSLINKNYQFEKNKALYSDLKKLIKYRNQIAHPKPYIERDGEVIHIGNIPDLYKLTTKQLENILTLPFRLISHLKKYEDKNTIITLSILSGFDIDKLYKPKT